MGLFYISDCARLEKAFCDRNCYKVGKYVNYFVLLSELNMLACITD